VTPEEAHEHLAAIRRVIDRSRAERARSGDLYVVWGTVLVAADVFHLALDARGIPWGWVAWPISSIVGGTYAAIVIRRREQLVRTFGSRIEGALWMSMGAAMTLLIFGGLSSGAMRIELVGPLICSMVAVAMITSATLFDSPLMRASGVLFLVIAVGSFLVPWQAQYALFGVGLLFGYILPGLWWMREDRRARDG
jgi:hypothetical protein